MIRLWAFDEVKDLEYHMTGRAGSRQASEERRRFLRDRAHRVLFGMSFIELARECAVEVPDEPSEQEAAEAAKALGFDIRTEYGGTLKDWEWFWAGMVACSKGATRRTVDDIRDELRKRGAKKLAREAFEFSNRRKDTGKFE